MNEWISILERLPEEKGKYLVCDRYKHIHHAVYDGQSTMFYDYISEIESGHVITDPAYWMPYPEAPKEISADILKIYEDREKSKLEFMISALNYQFGGHQ